jgi:hypothetical protein
LHERCRAFYAARVTLLKKAGQEDTVKHIDSGHDAGQRRQANESLCAPKAARGDGWLWTGGI